jgi:EAL and modified HD-GYP domain-containing signal transduction protein
LSQDGYEIALDDFLYRPELAPLIAITDIIKFDFMATPVEEIKDILKKIPLEKISLLAEKIETYEEFKIAEELGFKYFQGYFFSKPEVLNGKDITGAQMNYLEIMAEVNKQDFKFSKVEKIIERDVAISYKLMRHINSAFYRRVNEISSIKQAVVLMGEKGIRSFLSLIALTDLASDKPDELIRSSILRAKFCELVGMRNLGNKGKIDPSEMFTLGLFSTIDAILNDTMENLMAKLPLSEMIKTALIKKEGELYDYLNLAICYEKGLWSDVSELESTMNLDEAKLPESFTEALEWADAITAIQ